MEPELRLPSQGKVLYMQHTARRYPPRGTYLRPDPGDAGDPRQEEPRGLLETLGAAAPKIRGRGLY